MSTQGGMAILILEAEYCDNMIIMQDGKAIAQGSVEKIIKAAVDDGGTPTNLEDAFVYLIRRR